MSSPLKHGVLWKVGVVGCLCLCTCALSAEDSAGTGAPTPFSQERSTGVSRQVVVYSRDREARQRVVSGAEDTKRALLEVLGLPDGWQLPVIVTLQSESAFAATPSKPVLVDVPGGRKIEMALLLAGSAGEGAFREEFARAFLLEMACRNLQADGIGKAISMPPPWLIDGILALEEFRKGEGDALLYQAVVRSGYARDPRSWLGRDPALLDTTSRAVYRLASAGLVQALLEQPEGAVGVVGLLRAGVGSETSDPFDRIFEAYPSLNKSLASLVKRWSIQLARFASTGDIDLLGVGPTEEARETSKRGTQPQTRSQRF